MNDPEPHHEPLLSECGWPRPEASTQPETPAYEVWQPRKPNEEPPF